MKRALVLFAALALLICGVEQARADYSFSYSDALNAGYGTLSGSPSGLGDGSLLITSGSLTVTSSADGILGTYSLIPTSSLSLYSPPTVYISPDGQFIIDDLLYPGNNAGSGVNPGPTYNPSDLTYYGLLFGDSGTYINIWGNGGATNYEYGKSSGGSISFLTTGGTFVTTPEPSGIALFGMGIVCLAAGCVVVRKRNMALSAA
jgi:hypothetical protein